MEDRVAEERVDVVLEADESVGSKPCVSCRLRSIP